MENLDAGELMELVTFYKQKAHDTEFGLLQTQLRYNKSLSFIEELKTVIKNYEEEIKNIAQAYEEKVTTLQESEKFLEQQIADLLAPKPKARKPRS